jgi:hypothetical protein
MLLKIRALKEELQRLCHRHAGGQPARPYFREGRMSRLGYLDSPDIFSAIGSGQCESLPCVLRKFGQVRFADFCMCDIYRLSREPMDDFHAIL